MPSGRVALDWGETVSVRGVVTADTGRSIDFALGVAAIAHGLDPVLLVALAIAESNLREGAIGDPHVPGGSHGLFQIAVKYHPAHTDEWYRVAENSIAYAAPIMARNLVTEHGDWLRAMYRWNKPSTGVVTPAIDANYRRGLVEAERYRVPEETNMPTDAERIATLEQQQAYFTETMARLMEGKWTGGVESAVATLLAINPGLSDREFLPYPGVIPPDSAQVPWSTEKTILGGFTVANRHPGNITSVVWHTLEGSAQGAVDWWNSQRKSSAHIIVLKSGDVWRCVPLEYIAWHAGTDNNPSGGTYGRTSFWRANNVNGDSIGVECEGFAGQVFPAAQIAALRKVSDWLHSTYPILRQHTFYQIGGNHAHSEISASRGDPGPTFKWEWVL